MAYNYGTSPVAELPTPLDGTPLDATSWAALTDAVGVRTIHTVASQVEQDEYLGRVTAAGLGPSTTSPVTVRRADLAGLVMTHEGVGWRREFGGSLVRDVSLTLAGSMSGGNPDRGVASVSVDLPCAALVTVAADVKAEPLTESGWNLGITIRDGNDTDLTQTRWYNKGSLGLGQAFNAILNRTVALPAGSSTVRVVLRMTSESSALMLSNAALSVSYA